jgi:ABC-type branched-subunit amino acid transport system substrate-binding protein
LRKLKSVAVVGVAMATLASVAVATGPAGAQGTRGPKEIYIIGSYETRGESAQAIPNFDDGAKLAVKDLQKKGYKVTYERIPASGTIAASQEQAFLAAQAKNPDAWIGLTSSNVFIPVGPKVAATDIPTFALAAPSEGVKTGPSGGDNIFLVRPLNEQTYSKVLQFVCTDLKKQLKLKEMKVGLNIVTTAFGTTVETVVKREIPNYKGCTLVTTQTNSATATDLTQQALGFKNAGVDAIISANFPNPSGVLVNQLRQNGVTVPFVGGASLNIAKDSGSIQSLDNLWATDDCVPELEKDKKAKKFVKEYMAEYNYPPNYASAQVYDVFHVVAQAVEAVGHDHAKLIKKIAGTNYDGVCDFTNDKNNVLAQSVTVYKYNTDGSKKLVKRFPIEFVPNEELVVVTTVPPTTAAAG